MKQEPLKDKGFNGVYREEQIKSAVEWFKKELIEKRGKDDITAYDLDIIFDLVNEAFEDVIK